MNHRASFFKTLSLASIIALASASPASLAQHQGHTYVVPFVFDPDNSGSATARFFSQGHAIVLHLTKTGLTDDPKFPDGVASGAHVLGVIPRHITELGFDLGPGSQCGGGAPRFNVFDDQGHYWFFVCNFLRDSGTVKTLPNGYERIRCNPQAIPPGVTFSIPPQPDFTSQTNVTKVEIIFDVGTDEGTGFANLANITINDQVLIPHTAPL